MSEGLVNAEYTVSEQLDRNVLENEDPLPKDVFGSWVTDETLLASLADQFKSHFE